MSIRKPAVFLAIVAIAMGMSACIPSVNEPSETRVFWENMPESDKTFTTRYVDCVNSRFPLQANRRAYVSELTVAFRIRQGQLDKHGMTVTAKSLGCGDLKADYDMPDVRPRDVDPWLHDDFLFKTRK